MKDHLRLKTVAHGVSLDSAPAIVNHKVFCVGKI